MSFLHPLFLFGALAVAVPIIIHYVFKMKAPIVLFPSVRFLRQVDRQVAKRQKLQELLLLLLRCLALLLLALALAGPVIKPLGNLPGSAGTAAVIVLDDSYSMSALDAGGLIFARAKGLAATILNTFHPGDSAGIFTSRRPAALQRDLTALEAELNDLQPSMGGEPLGE